MNHGAVHEAFDARRKIELEPARDRRGERRDDDAIESLGVPDLRHGEQRVSVADGPLSVEAGRPQPRECSGKRSRCGFAPAVRIVWAPRRWNEERDRDWAEFELIEQRLVQFGRAGGSIRNNKQPSHLPEVTPIDDALERLIIAYSGAVRTGHVGRRAKNIAVGRALGKAGAWRRLRK